MTWHSPQAFWLFCLLIGVYVFLFLSKQKKNPSIQISSVETLRNSSSSWRITLSWIPETLKFISISLVIIALARPQKADSILKRNVEGIDIMVALDISDSMLIEDMKPMNRIEAARSTLKNFIQGRNSDRIGIVIFAGESFTLVPLTLDYELIKSRVDEIRTSHEAHIKDGTALGVAMASAAGHLKDSKAKSKIIIFLTDGENNTGTIDPETGLEIAKGYGIKVYSIGIGRDGPTRIPIYKKDLFGNKVKDYQPFESTINEDLLNRMGKETGGKFFRAIREDSLQGIFKEIDQLERTHIEVNKFTRYTELFPSYLLWALWIYFLYWLLFLTVFRRIP